MPYLPEKKEYYAALKYSGYSWAGYWDDLHHFTRQDPEGWAEIACTDEMLNNGDIVFMAANDLTYKPVNKQDSHRKEKPNMYQKYKNK